MSDVSEKKFSNDEWSVSEWSEAWHISVGKAYACNECGTMIMVTKGGIGSLEPICCKKTMLLAKSEE
jgi:hypothetical protein